MKVRNILAAGLLAMTCTSAAAQDNAKTENVFVPHWYGQLQIGGQYTVGERNFGRLVSPNAQLGVGYNFNKVVGARFSVNAWQSKAGQEAWSPTYDAYSWKWNYIQPALDATFNLTNLFCAYNPDRLVTVGVFGGIGLNIAFSNDEAQNVSKAVAARHVNGDGLAYLWDGTKARMTFRLGANVDFRISDAVSLGLEVQANGLNDHYNSKKAGNPDWYINALVGVKYNFGKTYTTRKVEAPASVERVIERVIEKQVPAPQPQPQTQTRVETKVVERRIVGNMRREIFFTIRSFEFDSDEARKLDEIADFLKENMEKTVTVTGYADRGTGTDEINDRIATRRADVVTDALVDRGVARDRIVKSSKGAHLQPFNTNDKNRVAICITD